MGIVGFFVSGPLNHFCFEIAEKFLPGKEFKV